VRVNWKTNKAVMYRMHVRPGDKVMIMKGKDKGKVTQVMRIYPKWNMVLCLGVNVSFKDVRPRREDEVGQRVECEDPIHSSWVMHYCEKEQVPGRLGIRYEKKANGIRKVRYNKASGEPIPTYKKPVWIPVLDRD